jgi:hypothetical protein
MKSVKQRLIDALKAELEDETKADEREWLDYMRRQLTSRGSGPLPSWLRAEAERRGIK